MTRHLLLASGLDPSGGAGLLADVRVAERFAVRPVGTATALTVQDSSGVRSVEPVSPEVVRDQLLALLADVELSAVKIGMLGGEAMAAALDAALELSAAPVVWDPVLRPSAGHVPLYAGAPERALELLAAHVTVATPNLGEAAVFLGRAVQGRDDMIAAAEAMRARGLAAVLVKGGHLEGEVVDVLVTGDGTHILPGERVEHPVSPHGTGCALSTAIACRLAHGDALPDACRAAAAFVRDRLRDPVHVGRGRPAIV